MYASNTPISRPAATGVQIDADFGGIAWSNKHGFCFVSDNELLPMKLPTFHSYRPTVR